MNSHVSVFIPASGAPVTLQDLERAEMQIASVLPEITDVGELEEMRDRFSAIEQYTKKKQLHLPTLGVQRRLEARIGQLLGEPENNGPATTVTHEGQLSRNERMDFRILARALRGDVHLDNDEWRQSRRALVALVKNKTPKEDDAMDVDVIVNPQSRVAVPDGMTLEDVARKGMAMENNGDHVADVARELNMNAQTYRKARNVVAIADHEILSERDKGIALRALELMNDAQNTSAAWPMVEPIADRLWGEVRNAGAEKAERTRSEQFEHSFGVIIHGCTVAAEMTVPYLYEERATAAIREIDDAIRNLRALKMKIQEIHQ